MRKFSNLMLNAVLCAVALLFLYPFYYMVMTSFTQTYQLGRFSLDFGAMNLNNYVTIFKNYNFFENIKNSFLVVVFSCFFNAFVSVTAAYAFSKKKFPGRDFIFFVFIATMMLPGQVKLIPTFVIMKYAGLLNTLAALVIPVINAFGIFLVKQFIDGLPDELIEAAKIDGYSEWSVFARIVVPLAKSVIVALTIFTFITVWNDFIWPLVILTDSKKYTLTLALSTLQGNYASNYGLILAGATLTFLPPFILYVLLRRQFVQGIAFTGSK